MKINLLVAVLFFSSFVTEVMAERERRGTIRSDRSHRSSNGRVNPRNHRPPRVNRDNRRVNPRNHRASRTVDRGTRRVEPRNHRPIPARNYERPRTRPGHGRNYERPRTRPGHGRNYERPRTRPGNGRYHTPQRDQLRRQREARRARRLANYGTRRYWRPHRYRPIPYRRYYHTPIRRHISHTLRYTPRRYYSHLRSTFAAAIYLNWILHPSTRVNGHVVINNYPYYVYNGYRHRYSSYDTCNYQLFDKYTHDVVSSYFNQTCSTGYNQCAFDRDRRNEAEWENRYECAETYRTSDYGLNEDCYDYDWNTNICYDQY